MSAPVKERRATVPAQRQRTRRERSAPTGVERRGAATRAYARRDDRVRKLVGPGAGRRDRAAAGAGRTPFVLLIMGLLAVGLVATLWLSTAAAADSFLLTDARGAATTLQEQSEQLRREVATTEAAPAIIAQAQALGMVPVQDPPRIVVAPDGSTSVVGTPHAVTPPAPVVRPTPNPAAPVVPPADAETQAGPGAVTAPSTDSSTGVPAGQSRQAAQPPPTAAANPTATAPTASGATTVAPTAPVTKTPTGTPRAATATSATASPAATARPTGAATGHG